MSSQVNKPRVSFCISTFRRTDFLENQLKAIEGQTVGDFEVIVCDNDFENGSAGEVVGVFNDSRFRYYKNESNLGMVKSFNRALSLAKGEFVVMVTDDDPVYPNMLEDLLGLAEKYPAYGMFIGSHDTNYTKLWLAELSGLNPGIHSGLSRHEIGHIRTVEANQFVRSFCRDDFGGGILWSSAIVRRELVLKVGGVPDYGTPFLSDAAYLIICGAQKGAVFLNKAVGCQTVHGNNYSYANSNYDYLELAPKAFYEFIGKKMPQTRDADTDRLVRSYIGKTLTTYFISLHNILSTVKMENQSFKLTMAAIYRWEVMRKWKLKYQIATGWPKLFELLLQIKKLLKG